MSKKAWDDSHKYSVELTAREIRVISACLTGAKVLLNEKNIQLNKINTKTLDKLFGEFGVCANEFFSWGLYPDTIGDRVKRVEPPIDKP